MLKPKTSKVINDYSSGNSKASSHVAYHVREAADDKRFWPRIGSAWLHGDGKGFTLQIDAIPFDGRITLRVVEERQSDKKSQSRQRASSAPAP